MSRPAARLNLNNGSLSESSPDSHAGETVIAADALVDIFSSFYDNLSDESMNL
jgi:hypothetical protein